MTLISKIFMVLAADSRENFLWKTLGPKVVEEWSKDKTSFSLYKESKGKNPRDQFSTIYSYIKGLGGEKHTLNLLNWYVGSKKNPKSLPRLEDVGKAIEPLELRQRFSHHIKTDPSLKKYQDINAISFKDLLDLRDTLSQKVTGKEKDKGEKEAALKDVDVIVDNDKWFVGIPKTKEASCFLGKGTRWCTAANKNNMFKNYNDEAPLVTFIKKGSSEKYQLWITDTYHTQFMDDKDEPIKKEDLKQLLPLMPEVAVKVPKAKLFFDEKEQLEAVRQNGNIIQHIPNPSEKVQLEAVKDDSLAIQFIQNPSEKVKLEAVRQDGYAIQHIPNPSEKVKLEAVKNWAESIQFIPNPSEQLQLEAVKQHVFSIECIPNPSEKVKLEAVKNWAESIQYIPNPSEQVIKLAFENGDTRLKSELKKNYPDVFSKKVDKAPHPKATTPAKVSPRAKWWESLTRKQKQDYLKLHPNSKFKL